MGHRFSGTTFAPDDLSEVIKAQPDLVIMDMVMSGEKVGWQLLQKMRMSRETQNIPVLICTAVTQDLRDQEGRLISQAAHLVAKPFSVDQLELAVTKALALPAMGRPRDRSRWRSSRAHPAHQRPGVRTGRQGGRVTPMQPVLISCPVTGDLVPTGTQAATLGAVDDTDHLLIDCVGCGQDHAWVASDATVAPGQYVLSSQQRAW